MSTPTLSVDVVELLETADRGLAQATFPSEDEQQASIEQRAQEICNELPALLQRNLAAGIMEFTVTGCTRPPFTYSPGRSHTALAVRYDCELGAASLVERAVKSNPNLEVAGERHYLDARLEYLTDGGVTRGFLLVVRFCSRPIG